MVKRLAEGLNFFHEVILGAFGMISYITFFCFSGIALLLAISIGEAFIIGGQPSDAPLPFLIILALVMVSLVSFVTGWAIRHKVEGNGPFRSELNALMWAMLCWWGALFRALFIFSIGITAYLWLKPQSIGDVPIGELTLNQLFANLFFVIITLGCVFWFFRFPAHQEDPENHFTKPYTLWGVFGVCVVCLASIVPIVFTLVLQGY